MSKEVLFGSCAAQHWLPEFREPVDVDYLVLGKKQPEKRPDGLRVEYHNADDNPAMRRVFDCSQEVVSLEHLLTIKLSHALWDINWAKTMHDVLFFQKKGVQHDESLCADLEIGWKHRSKKHIRLNVPNEDFFTAAVDREHVHDDIHAAIAYYDRPLYESIKHDKSKATVDYGLFLQLSFEDKLRLCREEIYVIALERFLIPKSFRMSAGFAYRQAARRLVTGMTKGWFPCFIVANWSHLHEPDKHPFVQLFQGKLDTDYCRALS